MPRRLEPTRAALADFDAIYDYISRDNPRTAAQVLRSLDRARLIGRFNYSRISQSWERYSVTDDFG